MKFLVLLLVLSLVSSGCIGDLEKKGELDQKAKDVCFNKGGAYMKHSVDGPMLFYTSTDKITELTCKILRNNKVAIVTYEPINGVFYERE